MAGYNNEGYDVEYYAPYDFNEAEGQLSSKEFNEYKNNVSYYEKYADLINEDLIFSYIIQNSKKYHKSNEYVILQKEMFRKFALEVERFCEIYGFN